MAERRADGSFSPQLWVAPHWALEASHARRLIFLKGDNAHDYKFSAAVLEDYFNVSPAWRAQFLATSVFNLRGQPRPRQCTGGADARGAESLNGEGPIEPLAWGRFRSSRAKSARVGVSIPEACASRVRNS
jgi:hypothetical protein